MTPPPLTIRPVRPQEYESLGKLLVKAYAALTVFAAIGTAGELLGSIVFIDDMRHYGSGGTAATVTDAAGVRLLAVDGAYRGRGAGKALALFCIERARRLGKALVVLHTTRAACAMYEGLGFVRFPELDFQQGRLEVFGFQLSLGGQTATAPV
jgi:ribosomal protein S18 acetylase RimI-like enzyme